LETETATLARLKAGTEVRGVMYRHGDSITVHARFVRGDNAKVEYEVEPATGLASEPEAVIESARQRILGAFAAFSNPRFTAWSKAASRPPRYDAYLGARQRSQPSCSLALAVRLRPSAITSHSRPFCARAASVFLTSSVVRDLV
jgi:hypothetical protein